MTATSRRGDRYRFGGWLQMTPTMKETLIRMSEGNPGALNVLVGLVQRNANNAVLRLDGLGLSGERIWILYKDALKEDISGLIAYLATTDDPTILADSEER